MTDDVVAFDTDDIALLRWALTLIPQRQNLADLTKRIQRCDQKLATLERFIDRHGN